VLRPLALRALGALQAAIWAVGNAVRVGQFQDRTHAFTSSVGKRLTGHVKFLWSSIIEYAKRMPGRISKMDAVSLHHWVKGNGGGREDWNGFWEL